MMTRDRFQSFVTTMLVGAILLTWGALAQAQTATRVTDCSPTTPNNAICLTTTAPTTNTDGTPITKPLTYRWEQSAAATSGFAQIAVGLTTTKLYVQNLAPGTYYFRAFVNCTPSCIESDASNVTNKAATDPVTKPNAPVIIIAATIYADGPPTYRIIQSVTLKPNEVVFAAPAYMRPLFANR